MGQSWSGAGAWPAVLHAAAMWLEPYLKHIGHLVQSTATCSIGTILIGELIIVYN